MDKLESELLNNLRNGDISAFNVIFKTYYSGLCYYASDLVRDKDLAREIVQDAFVKLWEIHSSIIIKSSLKAYVYRIVYNKCIDFLKQQSVRKNKEVQIDDITIQIDMLLLSDTFEPFDDMYSEQIEADLEDAMNNLPPQCRDVFILCRHNKLSYPQIAEKLGISVSSVKSQIKRAIDKLVTALEKYLEK